MYRRVELKRGIHVALGTSTAGTAVKKKAADILSGFDRMMDKVESMPVTRQEKKSLVKEWLRSRLTELMMETNNGGQQTEGR